MDAEKVTAMNLTKSRAIYDDVSWLLDFFENFSDIFSIPKIKADKRIPKCLSKRQNFREKYIFPLLTVWREKNVKIIN